MERHGPNPAAGFLALHSATRLAVRDQELAGHWAGFPTVLSTIAWLEALLAVRTVLRQLEYARRRTDDAASVGHLRVVVRRGCAQRERRRGARRHCGRIRASGSGRAVRTAPGDRDVPDDARTRTRAVAGRSGTHQVRENLRTLDGRSGRGLRRD